MPRTISSHESDFLALPEEQYEAERSERLRVAQLLAGVNIGLESYFLVYLEEGGLDLIPLTPQVSTDLTNTPDHGSGHPDNGDAAYATSNDLEMIFQTMINQEKVILVGVAQNQFEDMFNIEERRLPQINLLAGAQPSLRRIDVFERAEYLDSAFKSDIIRLTSNTGVQISAPIASWARALAQAQLSEAGINTVILLAVGHDHGQVDLVILDMTPEDEEAKGVTMGHVAAKQLLRKIVPALLNDLTPRKGGPPEPYLDKLFEHFDIGPSFIKLQMMAIFNTWVKDQQGELTKEKLLQQWVDKLKFWRLSRKLKSRLKWNLKHLLASGQVGVRRLLAGKATFNWQGLSADEKTIMEELFHPSKLRILLEEWLDQILDQRLNTAQTRVHSHVRAFDELKALGVSLEQVSQESERATLREFIAAIIAHDRHAPSIHERWQDQKKFIPPPSANYWGLPIQRGERLSPWLDWELSNDKPLPVKLNRSDKKRPDKKEQPVTIIYKGPNITLMRAEGDCVECTPLLSPICVTSCTRNQEPVPSSHNGTWWPLEAQSNDVITIKDGWGHEMVLVYRIIQNRNHFQSQRRWELLKTNQTAAAVTWACRDLTTFPPEAEVLCKLPLDSAGFMNKNYTFFFAGCQFVVSKEPKKKEKNEHKGNFYRVRLVQSRNGGRPENLSQLVATDRSGQISQIWHFPSQDPTIMSNPSESSCTIEAGKLEAGLVAVLANGNREHLAISHNGFVVTWGSKEKINLEAHSG